MKTFLGFRFYERFRRTGSNIRLATIPWRYPDQDLRHLMFQRPMAPPRSSSRSRSQSTKLISAPTNSYGRVSICYHRPPTRTSGIARFSFAIRMAIFWRFLRSCSDSAFSELFPDKWTVIVIRSKSGNAVRIAALQSTRDAIEIEETIGSSSVVIIRTIITGVYAIEPFQIMTAGNAPISDSQNKINDIRC